MDPTLHTFIAVGSLLVAFYSGKFFTKDSVPNVVEKLLDRLEKECGAVAPARQSWPQRQTGRQANVLRSHIQLLE